jgi:hypothetical protein
VASTSTGADVYAGYESAALRPVLYRETHTRRDELAEATLDGTRKERLPLADFEVILIGRFSTDH